ncbi:terminase large subunit domain-containing protein, partial [Klebsiella variicola]
MAIAPTLNIPQAKFLAMQYKFKAYVAGFGSGKTWVGCGGICKGMWEHPKINQGYFAPTYPQIRDIFYPTVEEVAHDWGLNVKINEGNKEVHFYAGRQYRGTTICRSMEKPQTIVGFKIGNALIDELDVMPAKKAQLAWRKIIARMRYNVAGLRNGIDVTTTPEGFKFVYQQFAKAVRDKPSLSTLYGLVQASTFDNEKNLPPDYIPSLMESYPPELIKAYLRGQFTNLTSGTIYHQFDRKLNNCREEEQPGEPLETHEHGVISLRNWLAVNVEGYEERDVPPLTIEVDGLSIPPGEWATCVIHPESDVRLYPVPFGLEAATIAWIGVGISVAAAAYSLFMMSSIDTGGYTSSTGRSLDLNPAKANTAKLGDPIREVFGRVRIYPDYVVQPVTRFDAADPTKMRVQMLLCLGVGELIYTNGDIRVGSTPASTLPGFNITYFPPGADVSGDERSENWVNSTEVGGTSSGTGLDMAQTSPDADDIIADSMTVSGSSVTFTGLDTDDDDDNDENENALPPSWVTGAVVELNAPANYQITTAAGYSVIASPLLTEIAPVVGMPVTLSFNSVDYDLVIASYTPGQDAVPGEGGSAAKIQASAAPVTYDFSTSSSTFMITWQGTTYTVSLVANYISMSGLLAAI